MESNNTSIMTKKKKKKFCDICWGSDGRRGFTLQTCKTCGVSVHNECYGLEGRIFRTRNPLFECWACKSVGTTVKVRERDPQTNKRVEFKVTKRPTSCILCGINDKSWMHAMHPVYDNPGLKGRQLVVVADGKPREQMEVRKEVDKQLAWAHTLCAFTINANKRTSGCVYGCTQDGSFSYDNEEEEDINNDSDSSTNSFLAQELDDPTDRSVHHVVYVLDPKYFAWTRQIQTHQNNLKCNICGKSDKKNGSFRIPLQCCANDENEYDEFCGTHKNLRPDETCVVASHVGCAFWGKNDDGEFPPYRRVFYDPGSSTPGDPVPNAVTNIFCTVHAKDLQDHRIPGTLRQNLRYPTAQIERLNTNEPITQPIKKSTPSTIQSVEHDKNQRLLSAIEKNIRLISNDLFENIKHLRKEQIQTMHQNFIVRVRARSVVWSKRLLGSNLDPCFNEALKRALQKMGLKMEKYPTIKIIRDLVKKADDDRKSEAKDVTTTSKANKKKKSKFQNSAIVDDFEDEESIPQTSTGLKQTRTRQTDIVKITGNQTKMIPTGGHHKEQIHSDSDEVQENIIDSAFEDNDSNSSFCNTRMTSNLSLPDSSSKSLRVRIRVHGASSDQGDLLSLDTSNQTNMGNTNTGMDLMDTDDENDSMNIMDDTRLHHTETILFQEIVDDILSNERISSNVNVNLERQINDLNNPIIIVDDGGMENAFMPDVEWNPLEGVVNECKLKWQARIREKYGSNAQKHEEFWNDVTIKVYAILNFSTQPVDWSFLVGNNFLSDDNVYECTNSIANSTEQKRPLLGFLEEWDVYDVCPLGNSEEV